MRYTIGHKPASGSRSARAARIRMLLAWTMLAIVMLSFAGGLSNAVRSLQPTYILTAALLATGLGWLLATLPMKPGLAAALSGLFGFEYLLVRVGDLGSSLITIVIAGARLVWEILAWYWTALTPDWVPLYDAYSQLWVDMGVLLDRTYRWLSGLLSGRGGYDVVGMALVWGLGVWLLGAWAGFVVRRYRRALLGVIPAGVLLGFVLSYTGSNPYVLLPILGATLVLLGMMGQGAREQTWMERGVDYSQGLWGDVTLTVTGISVALVIAAAIAPSISVEKIADWVREVTDTGGQTRSEAVAESLGLEQRPEPRPVRPIEAVTSTRLPQEHLIGSGPELSRLVVMVVETGELPPMPSPDELFQEDVPRHYWRSLTYDRYFGRGWATSTIEPAVYEAGVPIVQLEADYLRPLRQSVRLVGSANAGIVFVDGTLVSVDQPFTVEWRTGGELFAAITAVRQYRADSLVLKVTEEQLRGAMGLYPEEIADRYLQLPDSVPERVLALATDLTATQPTAYDRALAIETYLRQYEYTLDVPTPGGSQDIADFFLFELQKGYCDYYATSMVVLARAAGLPARMVVGYVSGTYDPMEARYVVTQADAHAWPEIYFPGYGWVEFEPTGGRPPIRRSPEQSTASQPETRPAPLVPLAAEPEKRMAPVLYLLLGAVGVIVVFGFGTGIDAVRLLLMPQQRMISQLYGRLRTHGRRIRVRFLQGATPTEVSAAFTERVKLISDTHGFTGGEVVEPAIEEVEEIVALYEQTWYAPDLGITPEQRRSAVTLWWRLRWRLWLAWLWRRSGEKIAK
jgi:transglutaminase-like putative cysteine protease